MSRIVQATCPGCQRPLRVPTSWLGKSVRCKFCGTVAEIRERSEVPAAVAFAPAPVAYAPPAAAPAPAPAPAPAAMPYNPAAPAPVPYAPPAAAPAPGWMPPAAPAPAPAPAPVAYAPPGYAPQAPAYAPTGYPPPTAPMPAPASNTAFDPGFTPAFGATATTAGTGGKGYRRKKEGNKTVMLLGGFCFMLTIAVTVLVLLQTGTLSLPSGSGEPNGVVNNGTKVEPKVEGKGDGTTPIAANASSPFPRRLLSINIANYLYANPIHNGASKSNRAGDSIGGGVTAVIKQISDKWRIPKDQVFELSDSLLGQNGRIPLKKIVEDTVHQFVETSRAQDRIVVLFTGHAVMADGKGYLVPLEGEVDNPETLIPLEWFYEELKRCKAQQKFVIFDVCRYDPGRGFERPAAGAMSEELDKALHTAPEGVQVWTSCSPGQYSYEFDYNAFGGYEVRGSLFLSNFFFASSKGKLGKGITKPDEPLAVETLVEAVTQRTTEVGKGLDKEKGQTPKLSGSIGAQVAFDPKEPPAKKIQIPLPPEGADKTMIASIVKQMSVPPIKASRKDAVQVPLENIFPFPPDVLKEYMDDDGVTEETILQNPEKYPLRFETVLTMRLLRELRDATNDQEQDLPEEFRGETGDEAKKQILALQRLPARIQSILERRLVEMENAKEMRDMETSKRWQAHFDFALAQLAMRYVYVNEYNLMLGKVRKDELPALDPAKGDKGWRLAAAEKMASSKEVRDKAAEAKELLENLIKEHPNTPWAIFAKRERSTSLGLQWQASNFGSE